jgi:hypothetical protein
MPRAAATPHSILVRIGPIELKAGSSRTVDPSPILSNPTRTASPFQAHVI